MTREEYFEIKDDCRARNKNMTKKEMENKKAECIAAGRVKVVEKTDTEEIMFRRGNY